jgi:hypothetical protein
MLKLLLADEDLDSLRPIADPEVERLVSRLHPDAPSREELQQFFTAGLGAIPDLMSGRAGRYLEDAHRVAREAVADHLVSPPLEELSRARALFYEYGTEICAALLLSALPEAYASAWGSRVLVSAGQLQSDLTRRIRATAQFVLQVLAPAGDLTAAWAKEGPAAQEVANLRLFHHITRTLMMDKSDPELVASLGCKNWEPDESPHWANKPLNQEDLLATMLMFSVTVFEAMEKFGIYWSDDDQLAYLRSWNFIGSCLGIGTPSVWSGLHGPPWPSATAQRVIPHAQDSVERARALLSQLRDRQWLAVTTWRPEIKSIDRTDATNLGRVMYGIRDVYRQRPNASLSSIHENLETEWSNLRPGRVLIGVLLQQLSAEMPRATRGLPLAVMRGLVPLVVSMRLGLGSSGLLEAGLLHLPKRRVVSSRSTGFPVANRVSGAALRFAANEVTRRAIVGFLQNPGPNGTSFVIPGLEALTRR